MGDKSRKALHKKAAQKANGAAPTKQAEEATPEFWRWLHGNLFSHEFFKNQVFPTETVLYSSTPRDSLANHLQTMEQPPESLTRENIYRAVLKACGTHKLNQQGVWFHVNVVDQCVWYLEEYKHYPYPLPYSEPPLATLLWRMENHPADQAGTTYVGLLGDDKKWLLLFEKGFDFGPDFKITFCGSEELCKTARSYLKARVL